MEKLLVVDDSPDIRKQLKWGLSKEYLVVSAGDAAEAVSLFRSNQPRVVTLDLGLPPCAEGVKEGFRALEGMLQHSPFAKIIVITGNDDRENALKAVRMGAYDYCRKPVDMDELRIILRRAYQLAALEEENRRLQQSKGNNPGLGSMVGQSRRMQEVFTVIRKVASADVPVLIQGESGTGKELVAGALHSLSSRKKGPFVALNCGAIPETLLEAELFGYEKGAFTGAHARVLGKFECSHKGTLFLDEIGELPTALQVKLLRFLQEKRLERLGGREEISVDTRIIAATNADIRDAMAAGRFREDLYYRIGVVTIDLPPLREREDDVLLLANLFLQRFSEQMKRKVKGFSQPALNFLRSYDWPGNVRELENRIQKAVLMADSPVLEEKDVSCAPSEEATAGEPASGLNLREARDRVEREMVVNAISRNGRNILRTAEDLGISRPTLYDLMRKHGLS